MKRKTNEQITGNYPARVLAQAVKPLNYGQYTAVKLGWLNLKPNSFRYYMEAIGILHNRHYQLICENKLLAVKPDEWVYIRCCHVKVK